MGRWAVSRNLSINIQRELSYIKFDTVLNVNL